MILIYPKKREDVLICPRSIIKVTLQREGKKDGKAYACAYFVIIKVDQDFTIKLFPSRSQLYCKLLP